MQKYKSNITTTSGAAVRGVPVLVIDEDGNNAALFLDRAGTVPAQNPLTTGPDGVFYFYAVNGRYSLRTTVDGVTITDDDVVLMMDPEEITVAGPIAEAVAAAQAAAIAAEFAVEASGIPDLVAAAQNAVVDSNNAVSLSATSANNAAISKTGADSARDAAVIAKNAAEAALDSFDDRYLGAKSVAPTTDNDGAALLTGALYWDTALPGMRSWSGSVWVTLPATTAAAISNTPAGSIAATTLQAAINELDAKKANLASPALTGVPTAPTTAAGTSTTQIATTAFVNAEIASINAAAISNIPYGSIAATTVQGAINELAEIKVDLASASGASLVGFQQAGTGAVARTAQDKMRDWMSAADFTGVDATGTTDSTTGLAAFVAAAKLKGYGIDLTGVFKVTQLVLDAANSLHVRGDCTLIGATSGSYSAVLEIKNTTHITLEGQIVVGASYNQGYAAGVKVWTDSAGGCSLLQLSGISVANAKVGWQFGDIAQGDRLLSEITVSGGYTFSCPTAAVVIGTQTFVNFDGYNLQASNGGGDASWLALPLKTIICIGGNVTQTGGEGLHTTSASGCFVELRPIVSATYGNVYGSYNGIGTVIETAAPLLVTANPAAVASPIPGVATSFIGCRGANTQDAAAFVQTDAGYTGDLVFSANDFYCTTPRTQANIQAGGACHIWCDDKSFGRNFFPAIKGIVGAGIPHFSQRMVLSASSLASQSLPNATATTLKYQALDNTGDLSHFASCYSTATGIFTVPAGGLKNVQVLTQLAVAGLTSAELYIQVNGVTRAYINWNKFGQGALYLPSLSAGDQVKVVLFNVSSGPQVAVAGVIDFLQIFASN